MAETERLEKIFFLHFLVFITSFKLLPSFSDIYKTFILSSADYNKNSLNPWTDLVYLPFFSCLIA